MLDQLLGLREAMERMSEYMPEGGARTSEFFQDAAAVEREWAQRIRRIQ
jgi:hypothetical protein